MDLLIDSLFTKKQMAVYDNLYISPYPSSGLIELIFSFFLFSFIELEWFCAGHDTAEAGTGHCGQKGHDPRTVFGYP
jgi:hypothetical protein